MYNIELSKRADKDLKKLKKNEPQAYKKAQLLLSELKSHPTTGTGKIEQLKGRGGNVYSRRINSKHRLEYQIFKDEILVYVVSAYGHYDD